MDYASLSGQAGTAFGQTGNTASGQAPEVSPFLAVAMTANNVSDLAQRVRSLADRVAGTAPTPISEGSPKQPNNSPPPAFHALRLDAERMGSDIGDAHRALDRIERMLP